MSAALVITKVIAVLEKLYNNSGSQTGGHGEPFLWMFKCCCWVWYDPLTFPVDSVKGLLRGNVKQAMIQLLQMPQVKAKSQEWNAVQCMSSKCVWLGPFLITFWHFALFSEIYQSVIVTCWVQLDWSWYIKLLKVTVNNNLIKYLSFPVWWMHVSSNVLISSDVSRGSFSLFQMWAWWYKRVNYGCKLLYKTCETHCNKLV